eukprot:7412460-Pyramimonas_sp.AAC.1
MPAATMGTNFSTPLISDIAVIIQALAEQVALVPPSENTAMLLPGEMSRLRSSLHSPLIVHSVVVQVVCHC